MATTEKTIAVEPGGEIDRLLAEADGAALILVRDGVRYRLHRDEPGGESTRADPWANYDPNKALAGMLEAAGSISEAEADEMIANIYRWREEGSRPFDRK